MAFERLRVLTCGALWLFAGLAVHATELRPPPEFTYDASGVTVVDLRAASSQVTIGNTPYRSMVFNDNYDAPLIRTRPGGVIKIRLDNRTDEFTNLHFHGMTVSPLNAGDSIFRLTNAHEVGNYDIVLPPDHSPGAYWYHSHYHKGAERQVSGGLSGPILVDGILDPFPELKGIKERVLVLRNFQKTFTGNQASEITTGAPSIRTINGQYQPEISIQPGEVQLWHLLNVDANQYFLIRIDGMKVQLLSQDGNTVVKEVWEDEIVIGPSARFSVLVTGPEPGRREIRMGKANTGPAGDSYAAAVLGTLVSAGNRVATAHITSRYPVSPDLRNAVIAHKRRYVFQDAASDPNAFYINGKEFDIGRVDTTVKLGDTEEWTLVNPSQELHQFHIHQVDFQVTKLNGKPVDFIGYRDNVFIPAVGSITIVIPFTDPVILGKFVYHCHILEHEDGGMMQVIQVVKPEDYEQAVKLEPLGGIYGDNQTCAYLRNTGRELLQSPSAVRPRGTLP